MIFHQLNHHCSQLLKNAVYLQLLHSLFRSLFGVMKDINQPPQPNLKKICSYFWIITGSIYLKPHHYATIAINSPMDGKYGRFQFIITINNNLVQETHNTFFFFSLWRFLSSTPAGSIVLIRDSASYQGTNSPYFIRSIYQTPL